MVHKQSYSKGSHGSLNVKLVVVRVRSVMMLFISILDESWRWQRKNHTTEPSVSSMNASSKLDFSSARQLFLLHNFLSPAEISECSACVHLVHDFYPGTCVCTCKPF